ncbi:hypothetical protein CPB83DRAFT_893078, partial [Crepidotus variabilis]
PNAGAHYHLEGKDPAFVKARVAELLKGDYIYPSSENGTPLKSRPYHHPAFIATLRDLYFTSPRRAVAVRYAGRFTSVIKEGHGKEEPEIPWSMLGVISVAVYSSLEEWKSGQRVKLKDFKSEAYEGIFNLAMEFLRNIQTKSPTRVHRALADLYALVSPDTLSNQAAIANQLEDFDVDAMPE